MGRSRTIREIIAERGSDPVEEVYGLVDRVSRSIEDIEGSLERFSGEVDPELLRAYELTRVNLIKTQVSSLKLINDAKQKEDDQRIKLDELKLKQDAFKWQQEKLLSEGEGSSGSVEYVIPNYEKSVDPESGKIKLIRKL